MFRFYFLKTLFPRQLRRFNKWIRAGGVWVDLAVCSLHSTSDTLSLEDCSQRSLLAFRNKASGALLTGRTPPLPQRDQTLHRTLTTRLGKTHLTLSSWSERHYGLPSEYSSHESAAASRTTMRNNCECWIINTIWTAGDSQQCYVLKLQSQMLKCDQCWIVAEQPLACDPAQPLLAGR